MLPVKSSCASGAMALATNEDPERLESITSVCGLWRMPAARSPLQRSYAQP